MIRTFDPFNDMCPFCLSELSRGGPEDDKCGHEKILETYPHLRFNADQHLDEATLVDSEARFTKAYRGAP